MVKVATASTPKSARLRGKFIRGALRHVRKDPKGAASNFMKKRPIPRSTCFVNLCNRRRTAIPQRGWKACQGCLTSGAYHVQLCCPVHKPFVKDIIRYLHPEILYYRFPDTKFLCPRHLRIELNRYSAHPTGMYFTLADAKGMYDDAVMFGAVDAFEIMFPGVPPGNNNNDSATSTDDSD
jgi:hypothetical protein